MGIWKLGILPINRGSGSRWVDSNVPKIIIAKKFFSKEGRIGNSNKDPKVKRQFNATILGKWRLKHQSNGDRRFWEQGVAYEYGWFQSGWSVGWIR